MARYQNSDGTDRTLAAWLTQPGASAYTPIHIDKRIGIHDSRAIEHVRTYLWDLTDYHVESVQAGVIWLRPRAAEVAR